MCFIFVAQINVIFMRPLYEAKVLCDCIIIMILCTTKYKCPKCCRTHFSSLLNEVGLLEIGILQHFEQFYLVVHIKRQCHVLWRSKNVWICNLLLPCFFFGWSYTHDRCADKNPYPLDRRADKDSYPHDRNVTDDLCSLIKLCSAFIIST